MSPDLGYLYVVPSDVFIDAGCQRLGTGFLTAKSSGKKQSRILTVLAKGTLVRREKLVDPSVAKSLQRAPDAINLAEVAADAEDHC